MATLLKKIAPKEFFLTSLYFHCNASFIFPTQKLSSEKMLTGGSTRPKKLFTIVFTFTIYIVVLIFFVQLFVL